MKKFKKVTVLIMACIMIIGLVGCGKATAESLKEDIENKKFSTTVKGYKDLETADKTKVDEYITIAIAELMGEYATTERTEKGRDEILKTIQELKGMNGISESLKIILDACEKVLNDYYTNQNTFNTAQSIQNPEDALIVYEALQEACKQDPTLLEKVNTKISEINEKITTEISKGSKIDAGGFDIKFNTFEFSYDVLPKNTSGYYTHYAADKGKVYYHVAMDLKNNNKQNITGDELLKAELVYNKDYRYNGFIVIDETDGGGFDYANITSIKPLEKRGIRILFDLPEEIESAKESVEIIIDIDGKKLYIKQDKEKV